MTQNTSLAMGTTRTPHNAMNKEDKNKSYAVISDHLSTINACWPGFHMLDEIAALIAPCVASRFISAAFPLPRKYVYTSCTKTPFGLVALQQESCFVCPACGNRYRRKLLYLERKKWKEKGIQFHLILLNWKEIKFRHLLNVPSKQDNIFHSFSTSFPSYFLHSK